jgi:hypothetical protein
VEVHTRDMVAHFNMYICILHGDLAHSRILLLELFTTLVAPVLIGTNISIYNFGFVLVAFFSSTLDS